MTARIEWLHAGSVDIDGTAKPDGIEHDGITNAVAAVQIRSQFSSGNGVVIEGPPWKLRELVQNLDRVVSQIEIATGQSPDLRRLYGVSFHPTESDPNAT